MAVSSGKRIAKNTVVLYARMAIVMVVNLYIVRLVLNALGSEDYGIYDVVAGIVTMFASVSSVLSIATQRFYSFSLGENNIQDIKRVYSSSINVYLVFALAIIIISETIGLWFLNTHLNIPDNRMFAANWVFHFSILSFVFLILQTPFSSAVMAYEDMGFYAIISLSECFLKLIIAFYLSQTGFDRLIMYGFLLMTVSALSLLAYIIIVKKKYKDCQYGKQWANKWKDILSFSGWTFCASLASIGMTQVCTILVNIFFGPIVNAARAIAGQISSVITAFCNNFLMAVRPPMVKSYAEQQYDKTNSLFLFSNKFTFYILLILFIPLFSEMGYVLHLWLGVDDSQTILFSRLMLIYTFIFSLNNPITFVMHATGKVKQYHTLVEIPTLLVAPITYVLYLCGLPAHMTYITMICAIIVSHLIRIMCLRRYYEYFRLDDYLKSFLLRATFVTISLVLSYTVLLSFVSQTGIVRLVIAAIISIGLALPIVFYIGLSSEERKVLIGYAQNYIQRNSMKS